MWNTLITYIPSLFTDLYLNRVLNKQNLISFDMITRVSLFLCLKIACNYLYDFVYNFERSVIFVYDNWAFKHLYLKKSSFCVQLNTTMCCRHTYISLYTKRFSIIPT